MNGLTQVNRPKIPGQSIGGNLLTAIKGSGRQPCQVSLSLVERQQQGAVTNGAATLQKSLHELRFPHSCHSRQMHIGGSLSIAEISLISDQQMGHISWDLLTQQLILSGPTISEIKQQHDQIGTGQSVVASGDAQPLNGIIGAADAGGVEQRDRNALQHDFAFQQVSRGSGQIGHDGSLPPTEPIQKGALANVGPTDERHPQPLTQGDTALPIRHKLQQLVAHRLQSLQQVRAIENWEIIFKIHPGLQLTELIQQSFTQQLDPALDAAVHPCHGQLRSTLTAGSHQITDRLSTRELKAPVQDSSLTEFTGQCTANPRLLKHTGHHLLHCHHAAMAMDFHHIFSGETARSQHQQHQHFIEVLHSIGCHHVAVEHSMALPRLFTREAGDLTHSLLRIRA